MRRTLPALLAALILVAADVDLTKQDVERLQGDWVVESMIRDGMRVPDDDAQALFRNIKGDAYTVARFSKIIGKGTQKIDATKKPKMIDFQAAGAGGKAGPMLLGIYELDGDTWTVCFAPPGKDRPAKLASEPDSGHTLTVWKREKK